MTTSATMPITRNSPQPMSNMAHFSAEISGTPGRAAITRGD
jgi:hypothetical protein